MSGARSDMARFDVYRNTGTLAAEVPYLVVVQADLLDALDTRVVVPLRRRDRFSTVKVPHRLMPVIELEGVACLLEVPKLAAVPARMLRDKVCSVADHQADITAALDFVFQGF